MKPEAAEHLDRAGDYLIKARNLLDVLHYNDEAGRAAYLAALHAAQALIFERIGRHAGSHGSVNSQFNLLTRGDPRIDAELRRFLPRAYDLKAVADYEAGPGSVVPLERVEAAIATARRFVEAITELLDLTARKIAQRFRRSSQIPRQVLAAGSMAIEEGLPCAS